jgi:iron complex transport system substrate-binding protein
MPSPLRRTAALAGAVAATAALAACGSSGGSSSAPASSAASPAAASSAAGSGAAAASPSASVAFPVTVTAQNGAVTLTSAPARIVSLDPTATEDLYAVGAGRQVVAADADSNYPAGVPKTSLSGLTPNLEAIARYNPALVVAAQDSGGLVSGLKKLGIPVLIEPAAATLTDAYAQIGQIGQATGHPAQAATVVAGMKQQIAATVARAGSAHQGLTYYLEVSANPYYSVTSTTFLGQVAGLFGLKNIADKAGKSASGGYPQLTPEFIVTAKPQLILLTDNQASDGGQSPAIVARRPGWSAIPAVAGHEVIGLNDDVASRWGPRLPQLVAEIAAAVTQAAK